MDEAKSLVDFTNQSTGGSQIKGGFSASRCNIQNVQIEVRPSLNGIIFPKSGAETAVRSYISVYENFLCFMCFFFFILQVDTAFW